ncbi:hypothetical protein [Sorangium cellulosum]|uniref:hypothetical protein n=1 Tax=Sorangium cellulosum TaxID=56 RepID=UPI0013318F5C|nr:hypothetical protein [Sorangium cellulosum]
MKLVRKALPYSVTLILPALLAACALAPESPEDAEGEDVAEMPQALPISSVLNIYYSDENFTTKVGQSYLSCVPGPIVYSGRTSLYYYQHDVPCSNVGGPRLSFRCIDSFCTEF